MASDKQDSAGTTCGSHHLNFRFSKVQRWEVKPGLPHRIRGIHRRHRHSFRYESVPINHNPCVNVTFSEVTGCTAENVLCIQPQCGNTQPKQKHSALFSVFTHIFLSWFFPCSSWELLCGQYVIFGAQVVY